MELMKLRRRVSRGEYCVVPISTLIERALEEYDGNAADSIESVIRADRRGRECVTGYVAERSR